MFFLLGYGPSLFPSFQNDVCVNISEMFYQKHIDESLRLFTLLIVFRQSRGFLLDQKRNIFQTSRTLIHIDALFEFYMKWHASISGSLIFMHSPVLLLEFSRKSISHYDEMKWRRVHFKNKIHVSKECHISYRNVRFSENISTGNNFNFYLPHTG